MKNISNMIIKNYSDILKLIEYRRKHLKVRVNDIADFLKITQPNASNIVNGKSQLRFDQLTELLKFLGVELETKDYYGEKEQIEKRALELYDEVENLKERLNDKDSRVKYLEFLVLKAQEVLSDDVIKEATKVKEKFTTDPLLNALRNEKVIPD